MSMKIPQKIVKKISDRSFIAESKKGKKYIVDCLKDCNPNLIIEDEYYFVEFHFSPQYNRKIGYLTGDLVESLL